MRRLFLICKPQPPTRRRIPETSERKRRAAANHVAVLRAGNATSSDACKAFEFCSLSLLVAYCKRQTRSQSPGRNRTGGPPSLCLHSARSGLFALVIANRPAAKQRATNYLALQNLTCTIIRPLKESDPGGSSLQQNDAAGWLYGYPGPSSPRVRSRLLACLIVAPRWVTMSQKSSNLSPPGGDHMGVVPAPRILRVCVRACDRSRHCRDDGLCGRLCVRSGRRRATRSIQERSREPR